MLNFGRVLVHVFCNGCPEQIGDAISSKKTHSSAVCLRLQSTEDVVSEFLKCIYEDTELLLSVRKQNLQRNIERHVKPTTLIPILRICCHNPTTLPPCCFSIQPEIQVWPLDGRNHTKYLSLSEFGFREQHCTFSYSASRWHVLRRNVPWKVRWEKEIGNKTGLFERLVK